MYLILKLTPAQYQYVATAVAYSLTAFPPWPHREKSEKELAEIFGLTQDDFENWYLAEDLALLETDE